MWPPRLRGVVAHGAAAVAPSRLLLQANAKVTEGRQHPDRDAQFHYLNDMAEAFITDDQPVISVDTKKRS